MNNSTRYIVSACAALAIAGCSLGNPALAESRRYLEDGNVYLAYHVLERNRPETYDLEFENEFRSVRLRYLLERGRELVYDEHEAEGIEYFSRALALDAGNAEAEEWIGRARRKLAREATYAGDVFRFKGELNDALKSYAEALEHVPGFAAAEEGKALVAEHFKSRHAKAQTHVTAGNRELSELRNPEAFRSGTVALEEDPLVAGAKQLYDESQVRLARRRIEMAETAVRSQKYGAALGLYREAKSVVPDYEGIDGKIADMEREVEAVRLRTDGAMSMARAIDNPSTVEDEVEERLDQAEALLTQAYDLSAHERPSLSELLVAVRERRFERRYARAADLVRGGRPHAALDLYRSIDEAASNGYLDVKARINSLEEEIALAEEAFAKGKAAQDAGEIQKALEHYREANLYCRNIHDVEALIRELSVDQ